MVTEVTQLQRTPEIRLPIWVHRPQVTPRGIVVVVHGLGEHAGRYLQLANWCIAAGFAVLVYDQRGHGLAPGKRGHAAYSDLLTDVGAVLLQAVATFPELPVYLYGHSMGGNVALTALLRHPDWQQLVKGLILTSPWISLQFKTLPLMVVGARLLAAVNDGFLLNNNLRVDWLSRNPKVGEAYAADPLVHAHISAGLFCAIHEAGKQAMLRVSQLEVPLLVMHGSDDKITSPAASKQLTEAAGPQAIFVEWTSLRHELHNEPEGMEVLQQVVGWMHML